MNNLKLMIKQRAKEHGRYSKLLRVKIGRVLLVYASLPLLSFWAYGLALPMMLSLSPTMWTKDKIREFKIKRSLR